MIKTYTKTSEAVSTGHPDKVADQISDAVLDYLKTFKKDPQSAVETACGANTLLVFGEIDKDIVWKNSDYLDKKERRVEYINPQLAQEIKKIIVQQIRDIGYSEQEYNPRIVLDIVVQSSEINDAVEGTEEKDPAAGDQGIVTGYAVEETESMHALHFILAHKIMMELEKDRHSGRIPWLRPDAKSQVSVDYQYDESGLDTPTSIRSILVSQSHAENLTLQEIRKILEKRVKEISREFVTNDKFLKNNESLLNSIEEAEILINPAGLWSGAGPAYDSGLTGRKLVVDNYGTAAPIGGGATSGKNLNKVDRSGAYFARHIAKSIVASGLAKRAQVELGFAIGVPYPTAINIETFGTETISLDELWDKVQSTFDFSVKNIIELSLPVESFVKTSEHGNYTNEAFPWEQIVQL